eukprot:3098764-Rhodomonas_salina.1
MPAAVPGMSLLLRNVTQLMHLAEPVPVPQRCNNARIIFSRMRIDGSHASAALGSGLWALACRWWATSHETHTQVLPCAVPERSWFRGGEGNDDDVPALVFRGVQSHGVWSSITWPRSQLARFAERFASRSGECVSLEMASSLFADIVLLLSTAAEHAMEPRHDRPLS